MIEFDVLFDVATDPVVLDQVIELGDRSNKTLGFLPFAGFRTAAAEGRIAVALSEDRAVGGYCLFSLPGEVVRIVQLCVREEARGTKLARALVEAVSAKHSDRLGLVLKCRADWPADKMWPRLDFVAQTQVPGRSKERRPLTVWWRSHGHSDLFSLLEERRAEIRPAAIDSNVYSDLHSAKVRKGTKQSAVLAPLIADGELNIVLLPTVEAELYNTSDQSERRRFLNAKVPYTRVTNRAAPDVIEHLLVLVTVDVVTGDPSLRRDAELIAEAYANGIDIFVTRDENAIRYLRAPAADLGVEVLHPTEVATFLDVEQAQYAYRPAQLAETTFKIQRLDRALTSEEVNLLLNKSGGERLTSFRALLAHLAAHSTDDVHRSVMYDGDSKVQAVWAVCERAGLEVPLLRVPSGPRQSTLTAQLSRLLRVDAVGRGTTVIRVADPHLSSAISTVLDGDGFYSGGDGLAALTLPIIGSWAEVSATAQESVRSVAADGLIRLLDLPENPSQTQTVEFERLWWPAKILGQGVDNFLVPIKAPFATQLLGYPASLMARPDDLGLSREHVYYSARRGQVEAPARIVWYLTGKYEPAAFASSTLVEVRVDTPQRLHGLYAHLGIWDLADVMSAARRGRAVAFRFIDTELFPRPVGLDRIRALAPKGRNLLLRSSQRLDDGWYERIYREGMQR